MKRLTILMILLSFHAVNRHTLVNTVWQCQVAKGCVDTYTFKTSSIVCDYDCELNYTFKCTYKLAKDTLLITEKDDSHSEDNGKVTYYHMKYLIVKNDLFSISNGELINGRWKDKIFKTFKRSGYHRIE